MKPSTPTMDPTTWFQSVRDGILQPNPSRLSLTPPPNLRRFNWALDYFDHIAQPERCALIVADEDSCYTASYAALTAVSNRFANYMRAHGVCPGERALIVMGNSIQYYAAKLACIKLGIPLVSVFSSVPVPQIEELVQQAQIRHLIADTRGLESLSDLEVAGLRLAVGPPPKGWQPLSDADQCSELFVPSYLTRPTDFLMGYQTSGTTSNPKLVCHSHQSLPCGHLSSHRWQGLSRGDVHLNVSSPGWAKHAWSSFFVPFAAEATVVTHASDRPEPASCLNTMRRLGVTSFCAPPSYWRALVRVGLGEKPSDLRNITSAGESLDEDVSTRVYQDWGLRIRNGYGQTEATAMVGFAPGDEIVAGGLGYALPGYSIKLVDPITNEVGNEGEICLDHHDHPVGLMLGYADETGMPSMPPGRYYRTGDLARRDDQGCFYLLGRADDMFKSYDVRISPLEIERVLQTHPLVSEIAVFAMPDDVGELVPAAACVATDPSQATGLAEILRLWQRDKLPASHRVIRVWMVDQLPKTHSGKISRTRVRDTISEESGSNETNVVPNPKR